MTKITLTPKHWADFQHYKNRAPAWIKLHRKLLDDFEFSRLPLASRALAPMLWLLASEYPGGKITATVEEIAFRLRVEPKDLETALKALITGGFFVDASGSLAERKQNACLEIEEEIEEEREEEKRKNICAVAPATRTARREDFEKFWEAYPKRGTAANPKKPAKDRFHRAIKSGADPGVVIAAAARFAEIEKADGRYGTEKVAMAVTWLNQERWNDYPEGLHGPSTGLSESEKAELFAKLRGTDGRQNSSQGTNLRPVGNGTRENETDRRPAVGNPADNQARKPGMVSLGAVLPRISRVRTDGDEESPMGNVGSDDGAGEFAP